MNTEIANLGEWMPRIVDDTKRKTIGYINNNPGPYNENDIWNIVGMVAPSEDEVIQTIAEAGWSSNQPTELIDAKLRAYLAVYVMQIIQLEQGIISRYPSFEVFISVGTDSVNVDYLLPTQNHSHIPIGQLEL